MMNNEYKRWYLVLGIFSIVAMFFGGSLAYWQWTTNTAERTSITLTVTEEFRCDADGGGNISSEEKYLVPTDCTNPDYAIQRTVTVSPSLFGDSSITMDLWLDIKSIGSGLKNSNNFKYALTTKADSCTSGVVKSGNFKGKSAGQNVPLFNFMGYNVTTTETYYLYIWLDKEETNSNTMNQNFSLSLNGTCTSAPEPNTYVVFNEEDTTLRLYKRDDASQVSNEINNNSVSKLDNNIEQIEDLNISEEDKVYIELENTIYSNASQLPWYEYRDSITRIVIEDEISPVSTAYWFDELQNVEYVDVRNLNTSNVIDMQFIFNDLGYSASTFDIGNLDNWNTSKTANMDGMFYQAGYNATTWNIGDLSNWDVSKITDMSLMFFGFGRNATTWNIGDLSNWNVSNVTSMKIMFNGAGRLATTWNIGDLSNWDVSKVTDMNLMFYQTGINATIWNIGDISKWDTSKVTDMYHMFASAGANANWSLDLSGWNVGLVTSYDGFNSGVETKITPPVWNTTS